ncbi:hydantoinase/oxoprolinase family protein [Streptococcus dentiloxodontae]
MSGRKVRMGIDVGGTHTKAVAIDNDTHEIIGKSSVKTTHDDQYGVATGVVTSFVNCMKENGIAPEDVVFVAHSTTQATNALLEGDVAKVGILGTAGGFFESFLAKLQLHLDDIDLGTGRHITIIDEFLKGKDFTQENVNRKIDILVERGAEVIIGSAAFGVDDPTPERNILEEVEKRGIMGGTASEITKLYGLTRRTRTAAINGSILPKMLDTASQTENSVRNAGVEVPLMIMRGDGGVMDITEMKKRPVLTMLSGPAASVMGALMYLRTSNGVYFEVGGTSVNIGVIKNGRPAVDYSIVGGHKTFVTSLDVRVLGVAGGSMVRVSKQGVVDVGPRSAHIAGLDYAVFADEQRLENCSFEFFQPKPGDPEDYVKIKLRDGSYLTITNSCAANVLGLVSPDEFSYGNVEAARRAMKPVADYAGLTVEELAEQILQKSFEKIEPVILELAEKYKLSHDQISLIGVGGGAASLIGYCADKMKIRYKIPENAEVISSIGVALSMVRDAVERVVPNPTPDDIRSIRQEAIERAIESGASPETVEAHVEIDSQTSKLTAIATGSTEVKSQDLLSQASEAELLELAAEDMGISPEQAKVAIDGQFFKVIKRTDGNEAIRILDNKGFIKVQSSSGESYEIKVEEYEDAVSDLYETLAVYTTDSVLRPDFYICVGPRIMDFNGSMDFDQILLLMSVEMDMLEPDERVILTAVKNQL